MRAFARRPIPAQLRFAHQHQRDGEPARLGLAEEPRRDNARAGMAVLIADNGGHAAPASDASDARASMNAGLYRIS